MTARDAIDRLNHQPHRLEPGEVWLAGSGPGDPGCLTLDVLDALTQADALVYDALVSQAIVDVSTQAERFHVGKRGGRPSMKQEEITALLVHLAREGRRVLRLKGGDPFVFGRGAEEALALVAAGIPFRVLPGLTSGIAGLAAAGIPATVRGINKAVILATGHAAEADEDLDWAALARTGQPVVIYMGLAKLAQIVAALREGGLSADTPSAVVMSATTPDQRVVEAPLGRIVAAASTSGSTAPALIVIGGIVSLRASLGVGL